MFILSKLTKIIKKHKVVIWEASAYISNFLKDIASKNVLGILDFNPELKNKDFCGYKIISAKELSNYNPEIIIGISENYYNYKKIIQTKLEEENINLKIVML